MPVTPMPSPAPMPTPTLTPPATPTTPGTGTSLAPGTDTSANTNAATKITAEVDKMSEIESSSAVVLGDTALVGVQFAAQYKGELTDRIKDSVTEKAKAADTSIKTVLVSADADLWTRIKAMATDVKNGDASGVATEFAEIVNRIMPKS